MATSIVGRWVTKLVDYRRFYFTGVNIMMNNKSTSVDDTLANNPFYVKYAAKISAMQQTDPQGLANRLEELTSKKTSPKSQGRSEFSPASGNPKSDIANSPQYLMHQTKKLDAIMKTELLIDKTADEIKHLWHDYYKNKDVVSAVLPIEMYQFIQENAAKYSTFLFPLPRNEGYEFMVCQYSGNEAHVTSLINFQTYGENAPECLTLIYYPDLAENKKIVLLKGDYNKDILNGQEAQCLVNQIQMYYGQPDERKKRLLESFTNSPQNFKHMDLVSELENITLDLK